MKLQQIANKQAHILHTRNSDSMILFSYETPVARYDLENDELLVLTTEGINQWLIDNGQRTARTATEERKNFPTTTRHVTEFKRILTDMNLLSGVTNMVLVNNPEHIL